MMYTIRFTNSNNEVNYPTYMLEGIAIENISVLSEVNVTMFSNRKHAGEFIEHLKKEYRSKLSNSRYKVYYSEQLDMLDTAEIIEVNI